MQIHIEQGHEKMMIEFFTTKFKFSNFLVLEFQINFFARAIAEDTRRDENYFFILLVTQSETKK